MGLLLLLSDWEAPTGSYLLPASFAGGSEEYLIANVRYNYNSTSDTNTPTSRPM